MICAQLLEKLKDYTPKNSMFTSNEEFDMIVKTLELDEATPDDLQNLRDMCVLIWSNKLNDTRNEEFEKFEKTMAAMQSITTVIDWYPHRKAMRQNVTQY